jgi:hypothetical protein
VEKLDYNLLLFCTLPKCSNQCTTRDLPRFLRAYRYLLLPTREAIHLVLHQEAQPKDIVTAYLQVGGQLRGDTVERPGSAAPAPLRVAAHAEQQSFVWLPPPAPRHQTTTTKPTTTTSTPHTTPNHQACILRKRLKTGLPASSDNLPELRIILHDTML